jgi:hypothetical protein
MNQRKSGLAVKCFITCFNDFPAVEWMLTFSNTSGRNTPSIEKAAVVDHSFPRSRRMVIYSTIQEAIMLNEVIFSPLMRKCKSVKVYT